MIRRRRHQRGSYVCIAEKKASDEWTLPVIPSNRILSSQELRSLTFACVTDREFSDVGLEVVLREMRKRTPVFPILDTLIMECSRLVAEQCHATLGQVPVPHQHIIISYWTMQDASIVYKVTKQVASVLRGHKPETMYLDMLLSASDADIESMVITLFDLHSALLCDQVMVAVAES